MELLVVISIIGILAALAVPVLNQFKPNYAASATRQLLDDLARARQLAISQHTTVLMVFVQTNFWGDPMITAKWGPADWQAASNLFDKQMVGYNFVSLRSLGDQPGQPHAQYLSSWRTLPQGAFIVWQKYAWPYGSAYQSGMQPAVTITSSVGGLYPVYGFDRTPYVPFPLITTLTNKPNAPFPMLPYIAFDYLGRRVDFRNNLIQENALIPLTKGNVNFPRNPATKVATQGIPTLYETPVGNGLDPAGYNIVSVDWLTGRAHVERQEVR
jgi:Tfp pilus assembly protein FimT